jgi:glycosyltransferase involved in cell wall biosynthesis
MENNNELRPPRIAVCILTRMREAGLTRALEGIAKQRVPSRDFSRIRVIVVDNDPGGSGQPVCDRLRRTYPWSLVYAVEPIVGIPYARNRALEMAMTADDLIAFLDDDEVPSEKWLAELLRVRREYSADVVFGPVPPYFPAPVPRWIERGAFFERETHPTGTVCSVGATNNVLMSTRMLRESGIRFDESYRFSGGSDTFFFMRVHRAGYRMIWADEAFVTEWIPKSRATLKWLAMRHFRCGALRGREQSIWGRLRSAALGMARVGFGAGCAVVFFPFGRHRSAKAIRWASYGLGLLYGAAGKHFQEYREPRGV